ncbi:MAG TPA: hypothetical protein VK636_13025 [Gemmatimonadaceae bacterium]|nr:hypothetical protein [Gemmatimonadaceae bacterium]
MPSFFPRQTIEFKIEEPKAFRRFSFSLAEMAVVTGVLIRLYRVLILTHGSNNWLYLGGTFALGLVLLLGMVTAHLANYPIHQYLWRAPVFAVVEVIAEMATSALLIALGHEANGTVRAHWDDWVGMSLHALLFRGLAIILWGVVTATVVQIVRRTIVREDDEPHESALPRSQS